MHVRDLRKIVVVLLYYCIYFFLFFFRLFIFCYTEIQMNVGFNKFFKHCLFFWCPLLKNQTASGSGGNVQHSEYQTTSHFSTVRLLRSKINGLPFEREKTLLKHKYISWWFSFVFFMTLIISSSLSFEVNTHI